MFEACDLVLVEGDMKTASTRIEVWRATLSTPPIALEDTAIAAVVSDDQPGVTVPVWPRSDVNLVAQMILQRLEITT